MRRTMSERWDSSVLCLKTEDGYTLCVWKQKTGILFVSKDKRQVYLLFLKIEDGYTLMVIR